MAKNLKHDEVVGPHGEVLKIAWMPDNRVRISFVKCGNAVLTKIFPSPAITNTEFSYGKNRTDS